MNILDVLESLYHISGIILVFGLFIAFKQLKIASQNIKLGQEQLSATNDNVQLASKQIEQMKEDAILTHKRKSVEKSLEYLSLFVDEIIPQINEYHKNIIEKLGKEAIESREITNDNFIINPETLDEETLRKVVVFQKNGCMHILNRLEYFSVATLNGLADEDILYTPLSRILCIFVQSNHEYLSILRFEGNPFENIVKLYQKWYDRLEVEELTLQVKEKQDKIMAKGDSYKSTQPIGVN